MDKIRIPITKPYIGKDERRAVDRVLDSGWLVQGKEVKGFEDRVKGFVDSRFAIGASSCTTALHLVLVSLGIGKGDEVILSAFTHIATANAIEYTGAKPVFCDISIDTFNIDVDLIKSLITKKTKAIIPVHLFGLPCDMDSILRLARKYGLHVIEDGACALGSRYKGRMVGSIGDVTCFSFHPRKVITIGEGGMLTTNNKNIADSCRTLRDHGASRSDLARHRGKTGFLLSEYNVLGYNYRMTDIQGALGLAQMKRIKEIISLRRAGAKIYDRALRTNPWLISPVIHEGYKHNYQSYVCLFTRGKDINSLDRKETDIFCTLRNRLMDRLEKKGISTRQGTHSVPNLGYYKKKYKYKPYDYSNSYKADKLSIALPLFPQMTKKEFDYVINVLWKVCKGI